MSIDKVFEALSYLVRSPNRLVSKDELRSALWPDAFVTDDSLVQLFVELRRALGNDAASLLKTVPRRGYVFTADVADAITLRLDYRPPLAWGPLLGFLAARAIPGVEAVVDGEYRRTLRIGDHVGWVAVAPDARRAVLHAGDRWPQETQGAAAGRRLRRPRRGSRPQRHRPQAG